MKKTQKNSRHVYLDTESFIKKAKEIHGDKYDYSETQYTNTKKQVCIICPIHGKFYQQANHHLEGHGCPKCAGKARSTTQEFIDKAKKIHGDKYDYQQVEYKNAHTHIDIVCPKHGVFRQAPTTHLRGRGCPKCAYEDSHQRFVMSSDEFIKKATTLHNGKYDYSLVNYYNSQKSVNIICPKHGVFSVTPNNHLRGEMCPACANQISRGENEIAKLIESWGLEIERRNKKLLHNFEIDIYIPSLKIGIEYNGLRWHSELYRIENNYHLTKTKNCEKLGIRLIHIFEDEWLEHKEIVISRLKTILSVNNGQKIYARKCLIKTLDTQTAKRFLIKNHLQGYCIAKYCYGLFYNNELVSLISFGIPRQKKKYGGNETNSWELIRFCNKLNTIIVGGASRLLQHFIKEVHPKTITTYADRRWSDGELYKTLGFSFSHATSPNYFYVVRGHREGRFKYRKSELIKQGYDPHKTEHEIMLERKIYRIYDCGSLVFIWNNPS